MATKEPKKTNSADAKNTKSVKSATKKEKVKTETKTTAKNNVVKKSEKSTTKVSKDKKTIVATAELVRGDNVVDVPTKNGSESVSISVPKAENAQKSEGTTNIIINLNNEEKKTTRKRTTTNNIKKKKKPAEKKKEKIIVKRKRSYFLIAILVLLLLALVGGFLISYCIKKNDDKDDIPTTPQWEITADGKSIYFGGYPQTLATPEELEKIDTESVDENGYYSDTDGNKYKKLVARPYGENTTFSDGTTIESGKEYFFKVEKIKWRILKKENNTALLLCESILDSHAYGDAQSADINQWLNDAFLKNFSSTEQSIILSGENQTNKVFLVDKESLTDENWFDLGANNISEKREKQATDYARANNTKFGNNGNGWWLYANADNLGYIGDDGNIHDENNINLSAGGVAPIISVNLAVNDDETATYTVKHNKQKLGNWKTLENLTAQDCTAEFEYRVGVPNSSVTPDTKSFAGFTAPSTQTVTVKKMVQQLLNISTRETNIKF